MGGKGHSEHSLVCAYHIISTPFLSNVYRNLQKLFKGIKRQSARSSSCAIFLFAAFFFHIWIWWFLFSLVFQCFDSNQQFKEQSIVRCITSTNTAYFGKLGPTYQKENNKLFYTFLTLHYGSM